MRPLTEGLVEPDDFNGLAAAAQDQLRLSLAYHEAHQRLAHADVIVRAAVDFVSGSGDPEVCVENLFDAVKRYQQTLFARYEGSAGVGHR